MKKLFWICLLLFSSCELIVDVDVPNDGDKIVLNSLVTSDSTWRVELSRSKYILEKPYSYYPIPVGFVSIRDSDGSTIVLTHDQFGLFVADSKPQPGHRYQVTAQSTGFTAVTAEMEMPTVIPIKNIVWDPLNPEVNGDYGQTFEVAIDVTIDDPADVENYYDATYRLHYIYKYVNSQTGEMKEYDQSTFARFLIDDAGIASNDEDIVGFKDKTFDGQTYTVKLKARYSLPYGVEPYKGVFQFRSLSESCFKYNESAHLQQTSGYDPFAQPVQVYSNINNGYGVFGGISFDEVVWER